MYNYSFRFFLNKYYLPDNRHVLYPGACHAVGIFFFLLIVNNKKQETVSK